MLDTHRYTDLIKNKYNKTAKILSIAEALPIVADDFEILHIKNEERKTSKKAERSMIRQLCWTKIDKYCRKLLG